MLSSASLAIGNVPLVKLVADKFVKSTLEFKTVEGNLASESLSKTCFLQKSKPKSLRPAKRLLIEISHIHDSKRS